MIEIDGIKVNGEELPDSSRCQILDTKLPPVFSVTLCFLNYRTISYVAILIYNKLGFDLSTKQNAKIAIDKKENWNKVIVVWNNLVQEFNDLETITKKLKE